MNKARNRFKLALIAGTVALATVMTVAMPQGLHTATAQSQCEDSPIVEWQESLGGNGHSYQVVCGFAIGWNEARTAAQGLGGYLATTTSAAELNFVFTTVGASNPMYWNTEFGPWLGGYQPSPGNSPEANPAGGWAWVTGETWSYTNWRIGEPNDGGDGNFNYVAEDYLSFYPSTAAPTWGDSFDSWEGGARAYVVEYEPRGQRDESRQSPPRIGAGLSGLFNGQPTPLPTAPAPAAVAPSTSPITPPRTGDAGLR